MSKSNQPTNETAKPVVKSDSAEFLTKLTLKAIGCNPRRAATEVKKVPLAHIFGIATGTKVKTDTKGDSFEAIEGNFEAVNLATGAVYRSGLLFLPGGIHETVTKQLQEPGRSVQFALEISAIPASNPIGYSYSAKSLIKEEGADPLAAMRLALAPPNKTEV